MAEVPGKDRAAIKSDIALSRDRMGRELRGLRYEVDLPRKFKMSFRNSPVIWSSAAAVVGALMAMAPARTKRVHIRPEVTAGGKKGQGKGILEAGALVGVLKVAATLLRPIIVRFVTAKMGGYMRDRAKSGWLTHRPEGERAHLGDPIPAREPRLPTEAGTATAAGKQSFYGTWIGLVKQTFQEWLDDKVPQLGAALAYYTVFSLAPLILVLLAIIGLIFRDDPSGTWNKMTTQMSYFLDKSAVEVVQNIAQKAAQPGKGLLATIIGVALALFGASGVFGQLQDALNTIWGVKPKPGAGIWGFLRTRFLSFAMVGGICFLLLVSLTLESVLKAFSNYVQSAIPGGIVVAIAVYWIFDLTVVILLFACIFKYLPDAKIQWRDVWIGAAMTAIFFAVGKWALGLYLGSGSAASAYGAASSLITLLLWIYYSSQILLFGAEFTQVYAARAGRDIAPDENAIRVETKVKITPSN